jgi:hypothetical protein
MSRSIQIEAAAPHLRTSDAATCWKDAGHPADFMLFARGTSLAQSNLVSHEAQGGTL